LEASVMIWFLIAVATVGVPVLALLADLAMLDTRRAQAVADAALRCAMDPLPLSTPDHSRHTDQAGTGVE
jgi:hypothetical protein